MVTVKKISVNELPVLVKTSYEGDGDLSKNFVNVQSDYMANVNSELFDIYELSSFKKLKYYKVIYQKKPIGYFVTFDNTLYSFGINVNYRKKDILLYWWKELKKTLNKGFNCFLNDKNERAIRFLEKNNMRIVDRDSEHKIVNLVNY